MRIYITVFLIQVLAFDADATTTAIEEAKTVTKQEFPTAIREVVSASSFQQYNVQAQCARLAELAGRDSEASAHLKVAKAIKPNDLSESDLAYRYGYVDGKMAEAWRAAKGQVTVKQLAEATRKAHCPVVM